jgi:hypothetical protein
MYTATFSTTSCKGLFPQRGLPGDLRFGCQRGLYLALELAIQQLVVALHALPVTAPPSHTAADCLPCLWHRDLHANNLNGTLPAAWSTMTKIEYL